MWFKNYKLYSIYVKTMEESTIIIKNKKLIIAHEDIIIKINLKKLRKKYNIKKGDYYLIIVDDINVYLNGKTIKDDFIKKGGSKMKCPRCGKGMKLVNNEYICEKCGFRISNESNPKPQNFQSMNDGLSSVSRKNDKING